MSSEHKELFAYHRKVNDPMVKAKVVVTFADGDKVELLNQEVYMLRIKIDQSATCELRDTAEGSYDELQFLYTAENMILALDFNQITKNDLTFFTDRADISGVMLTFIYTSENGEKESHLQGYAIFPDIYFNEKNQNKYQIYDGQDKNLAFVYVAPSKRLSELWKEENGLFEFEAI